MAESYHDINKQLVDATVSKVLTSFFPIETPTKILEISHPLDLEIDKDIYLDIPGQKEAKIKRKSWTIPLKADVVLKEKATGKVLSSKQIKLLDIPMMTNRFSFILDGNEYSAMYQWRLKPGVYTRLTNDGFYESNFNLALAKLDLRLDPESLLFYLMVGGSSEKFYLYPILKSFGVMDSQIKNLWGNDIFEKNRIIGTNNEGIVLIGFAKKVAKLPAEETENMSIEKAKELIQRYFEGTHLDAQVVEKNINVNSSKIDAEVLLATSNKLLRVMRGEVEEDERDSLAYKSLYNVSDRVDYYLEKNLKPIIKKIQFKMRNKSEVGEILTPDVFPKFYKNAFLKDELISPNPQTNPLEMLLEARKTTVMGAGGIQSTHAITEDVRNIHPSHIGILDPLQTPEGKKIGITIPLSVYTKKEGKEVKTAYLDKNGNTIYLSPIEASFKTIGFPGEFTIVNGKPVEKSAKVKGYKNGEPGYYDASEIDLYLKNSYQLWSLGSSLVPFLNSNSGNRASMAGRQMTQAVQLTNPEAPLVATLDPESKKTWLQLFGDGINIRAPFSIGNGVVSKITKDYITVKQDNTNEIFNIGLYNNFPLNQESFLDSTPVVKVGDSVNGNTILARTNFQASDGSLALGKNVNVAYMPWKGLNVEDAVVITETAANKLFVSESMQRETLLHDKKTLLDLNKFRALFPDKLVDKKAKMYDEDGVIKPGSVVEKDDYVIIAARKRELTPEQIALTKLNKLLANPYVDISVMWEFEEPGEVVYVNKGSKKIDVHIKMKSPTKVGDKFSGQQGNKMIVSKIIPDAEAPHTKEGKRADLIMHPFGVIGRTNIGQLYTQAAGKIAEKTGKPYHFYNFENFSNVDKVLGELKANNVEPNEIMTDGIGGKEFERPIFFGPQYIIKLKHLADHKIKSRSFGSYDINEQVVRGQHGGQSIDPLQWYALTAHGLKQNLAETTKYLNVKNDEFWRSIQLNLPLPKVRKNFVWDKFSTYLKGSGIDLRRDGNNIKMVPFSDKDLLEISGGEINQPRFLIGKNLAEIKGGFFDPAITGGLSGEKFSHIKLTEKIVNPIYEDTIQKLMGLTKKAYTEKLENGVLTTDVADFLSNLNIDTKLSELRFKIKDAKKFELPKLNYQIRVLDNLRNLKIKPEDVYLMQYFPIIPPKFRPIYPLPNGDLNASPLNYHYRDVGLINLELKEAKDLGIETKDIKDAKVKLYRAVKAAQGLGDPVTYDNTKEGIFKTLAGDTPGDGFIQGKLWRKRRDLSGRAVATVNPTFGIDEIGIPNNMLWEIYKPFVIKELVGIGVNPVDAAKHYKEKSPLADRALNIALDKRPIFMNRAPSLHKHSVLAFKPRRTNEISIQANPLIFSGYNLDFDGDQVMIYPPVTTSAVEEAWNALPSKVPYKSGTRSLIHGHTWDYKIGLFYATKKGKKTGLKFKTIEEARLHMPPLTYNEVFDLNGQEMTLGLWEVNSVLPESMRDYNREVDAKVYIKLLEEVIEKSPNDFSNVINKWKDIGFNTAFVRGQTLSITDMKYDRTERDKLISGAKRDIEKNPKNFMKIMADMEAKVVEDQRSKLKSEHNNAWDFVESKAMAGAKGKNIDQVLSLVGVVEDLKGNPVKVPIFRSWAEGQDPFDYWSTLYGARKGSVDKAIRTQASGYLNKSLLINTSRVLVTEEDCETDKFINETQMSAIHLIGRVLAQNLPGIGFKNDVITRDMYNEIKKAGFQSVAVRSPLMCEAKDDGVCQLCYGWDSNNKFPNIGDNVGVSDATALTEPLTQGALRSFHSGGKAGILTPYAGYPRADEILRLKNNLQGGGVLSTVDGVVDSIVPNPVGGFNVDIHGVTHYIPLGRELTVKKYSKVSKGDPLSDGVYKPQDIAQYKGIDKAREYMVNEIQKTLENKDNIMKKSIENVVKAITNRVEIEDPREDETLTRGNIMFENTINRMNRERKAEGLEPIITKPHLRNIDLLPLTTEDWSEMIGARDIKKVITGSAALGRSTNIHGTHPLPSYMYAIEFGDKPPYY